MQGAGLDASSANRQRIEQEALRFGSNSYAAVAEPFLSKNFHMQRALASGASREEGLAAIHAARATHLRMAHEDSMQPPPTNVYRNKFTGRSLESGTDNVAAYDPRARFVAAQWAGDEKMMRTLEQEATLVQQSLTSRFADVATSADPAFQISGRADKQRANIQAEATGIMPTLRETVDLGMMYIDDAVFNAEPPNFTVWEKNVSGWRALDGVETDAYTDRPEQEYERRQARIRGIQNAQGQTYTDILGLRA